MLHGYELRAWRRLCDRINLRDGFACQAACGCTAQLTTHHIIPRDEGGSDDPANLITLCSMCHDEIEGTSIRTVEGVRAYDAKWHALSSWWPTAVEKPRKHQAKREKPKQKMATARPLKAIKVCTECGKQYHPNTARSNFCCYRCRRNNGNREERERARLMAQLTDRERAEYWNNRPTHFPYYVPDNEGAK